MGQGTEGNLIQPLMVHHQWAVIQTEKRTNGTYVVDQKAGHTGMNIPVAIPALFLLNKEHIPNDPTFGK